MNNPTMHRPDRRHRCRRSCLAILAVLLLVPPSAIADTPGPAAPPATTTQIPEQLALDQRLLKAVARTADEISAGNHVTPDAAAKVFAARVLEARLKQ